jgi:hypothetical protein
LRGVDGHINTGARYKSVVEPWAVRSPNSPKMQKFKTCYLPKVGPTRPQLPNLYNLHLQPPLATPFLDQNAKAPVSIPILFASERINVCHFISTQRLSLV